jgi:hypothetical protein
VKRRALAALGIAVAVIGVLALRTVLEGRAALAEGDDALAQKRVGDALASWETAARWYFPGAPHVGEAYERLVGFARDPKHGPATRIAAWRAVRSAAHATTSLWTPHADDLAEADAAIAQLSAADPESAPAISDPAQKLAWHQTMLAREPRPSLSRAALAVLGILAWIGGIAVVIRRGASRDRPTLYAAGFAIAGLLAWAIGLYSA